VIDLAKKFFDIGVERVMIESEGITENVKKWRTDVIERILKELPLEKAMFEAADPQVFNWYITLLSCVCSKPISWSDVFTGTSANSASTSTSLSIIRRSSSSAASEWASGNGRYLWQDHNVPPVTHDGTPVRVAR
jgi:hypothetical protein